MRLRSLLVASAVLLPVVGTAQAAPAPLATMVAQNDPGTPAPMPDMPGMAQPQATPDAAAPATLNTPAHLARHKPHRKIVKKKRISDLQVALRLGFKKVSDVTTFPPFYPGLGIVTVRPDTLTLGPFRCFDRAGKLVASVYMPTLKEMNDDHKKWDYVHGLPRPVDHVTIYYHPGHPGVPVPHYHVVLWHVSKAQEQLVAK